MGRRCVFLARIMTPFLTLVALAWEGYKAIGPESGGEVLGWNILPRTNDNAMPHVWHMGERLFEDESRAAFS